MRVAYLDIETDYVGKYEDGRLFRDFKNHLITVLGVRVVEGKSDEFVQLVGEDITKRDLLQILRGVKRMVTYNGRSIPDRLKGRIGFDFPVIGAQLGIMLDQKFEHTDLVPECWKRNLYGGQKKVEEALGLRRELPGKHGAWAMEMWRKYVETEKKKYLEALLAYNREDIFMLREIELKLKNL
ncbi:MAG: ribonuclease H-like domain-containing protein [Candidatus Acidiferrales bacterium]